jgi:hypothetical protein
MCIVLVHLRRLVVYQVVSKNASLGDGSKVSLACAVIGVLDQSKTDQGPQSGKSVPGVPPPALMKPSPS